MNGLRASRSLYYFDSVSIGVKDKTDLATTCFPVQSYAAIYCWEYFWRAVARPWLFCGFAREPLDKSSDAINRAAVNNWSPLIIPIRLQIGKPCYIILHARQAGICRQYGTVITDILFVK